MWKESASHVPVLVYIAKRYQPKRVLEFGSGELSTRLFLDRNVYSNLDYLLSIEEDDEWFNKMQKVVGGDSRVLISNRIPPDINGFDLIFIDGPQDETRRSKVIGFVMKQKLNALIAIHDIEYMPYRRLLQPRLYYDYYFDPVPAPQTGLFSKNPFPTRIYNKVNRLMRKKFDELQEDWTEWNKIL